MSAHPLIDTFNQQQRIDTRPDFKVGDTIAVIIRVIEGEKERLQTFQGVVIAIRNKGVHSSCIVRKISHGIGVERTFQLHSRQIQDIQVVRRGLVRQAKIYYMRERVGKAARIPERFPKNRNKTNAKISVERTMQPATTPTAVEPVENTASNTTSSEQ